MADSEDLLDYDVETIPDTTAAPVAAAQETKKGSYVGIHATGFRDLLLRPELMKSITDCGFEHPSEGVPSSSPPPE